jgi:hypothetical protein
MDRAIQSGHEETGSDVSPYPKYITIQVFIDIFIIEEPRPFRLKTIKNCGRSFGTRQAQITRNHVFPVAIR